jgi:hypothetical protein
MSLPPKSTFFGLIVMQGPLWLPLIFTRVPPAWVGSFDRSTRLACAGSGPSGWNLTMAWMASPGSTSITSSKVIP